MRYICKACNRKREKHLLKIVGKSKNHQNVWLCVDGSNLWSNCNHDNYSKVLNSIEKDLDVLEQVLQEKRKRDLEFLHSMERKRFNSF